MQKKTKCSDISHGDIGQIPDDNRQTDLGQINSDSCKAYPTIIKEFAEVLPHDPIAYAFLEQMMLRDNQPCTFTELISV